MKIGPSSIAPVQAVQSGTTGDDRRTTSEPPAARDAFRTQRLTNGLRDRVSTPNALT
jgi:hypothetical protein